MNISKKIDHQKCGISTINTDKKEMKKLTIIFAALFIMTMNSNSQIPNNGFESLSGWFIGNASLSTDHYPESVGNYSIKLENQLPLTSQHSYGYAVTGSVNNGCIPSFSITGHPIKLCGYYKCFPVNGDTVQIGIELFKNGVWIAGGQLITSDTVSEWTSFNIPIYSYTESYTNTDADSATITVAAFYNDTTCGTPFGPFGNSVLYVDNLSFDSLITATPNSVKELQVRDNTFSLSPNPASNFMNLTNNNTIDEILYISIFTINGTIVKSVIVNERQKEIDISGLQNGVYFVTLKTESSIETKELIIQK